MSRSPRVFFRSSVLAALCAFAIGCGEDTDQARFTAAAEALADARSSVEEAQAIVDAKQQAVNAAQAELDAAKEKLAVAQGGLDQAQSSVDVSATDAVLFRAVQSALLGDEALSEVAIAAKVSKGVVALSGRVPDAELRNRAVEVAQNVVGITRVESRIEVTSPAPPAPPVEAAPATPDVAAE